MKNFTQLCVLVFGTVFLVFQVNSASADEFLGTFCWSFVLDDETPEENSYLSLGLNHIGDNHFTANGLVTFPEAESSSDVSLFSGNAEVVGNVVVLSLFGTFNVEDEEETGSLSLNATIPLANLNGTFALIETAHRRNPEESSIDSSTGTLTLIACP